MSRPARGGVHDRHRARHAVLAGGDFDAEKYDAERAERYARREGFY